MRRKKRKKNQPNILLILGLTALVALLIFFNYNIWQGRQEMKAHRERLRSEYEMLAATLATDNEPHQATLEDEVERRAREELLLKREGEKVIIISRDEREVQREEEEEAARIEKNLEEQTLLEKILGIFN